MADLKNEGVKIKLGEFIQEKKQALNITTEKLAQLSGVSARTISRYVAGDIPKTNITDVTFNALIMGLETTAKEFEDYLSNSAQTPSNGTVNNIRAEKFVNSPVSTQGNVVFNINSESET